MFDIWRVGYVRKGLSHLAAGEPLSADAVRWLPPMRPFQFIADPFGIRRDGVLTVFVEAFDYRVRRGEIHYYQFNDADELTGQGVALAEPYHLSYPSVIEDGGELYMLPEGYKSGGLTLYRCKRFPDQWEPVQRLLDVPAIDATVVKHGGRWWMFYALPGPEDRAMRELHVAYADALLGPWTAVAGNPVLSGFDTARPGGTAFEHQGRLYLPVQDCVGTYGAAVNLLRIDELSPDRFSAVTVQRFEPDSLLEGYSDGLHTLSGDDEVTFVDVKRICHSPAEGWVKSQYKLRRLFGLNGPRSRLTRRSITERSRSQAGSTRRDALAASGGR